MNPVRLIGGWLLLCGLSAAGAYFAIDEADRRFDLAKYDLRTKVGLSAAPSPSPSLQPATPAPGPSSGSSQPPTVTPPPQPAPQPAPQQPVVPPPQPAPAPTAPAPVQPGGSKGIPAPRPTPSTPGPSGGGQTTPAPVNPNPQPTTPPVNPNPQPANPAPSTPAPSPAKPTISTPDPRSTDDWRQLHDFYLQISPQADAVLRHMEMMKTQTERNRGVFRVDLQTAMYGLRDSLTTAKRALDSGDTDRARSYLTTAYQHLQTLEKARR